MHQLAALINDSVGVIATNTAAIQLAHAREKPRLELDQNTFFTNISHMGA